MSCRTPCGMGSQCRTALGCALNPSLLTPAQTPCLAPKQRPGYVVPTEIMEHFFEDVHRNGTFTGFPDLGLQLQRMESPALRWGAAGCTMGCANRCMRSRETIRRKQQVAMQAVQVHARWVDASQPQRHDSACADHACLQGCVQSVGGGAGSAGAAGVPPGILRRPGPRGRRAHQVSHGAEQLLVD